MIPARSGRLQEARILAVLVAAFVLSTGYGIVLPRLAELLARSSPASPGGAWRAGQTAGLTATFFGAALVAAPLSGLVSDRIGRRRVLAAASLTFAAGFGATALASDLGGLYASLILAGAATGTFEPVALAYAADLWRQPDARARRFAWINGAVRAGYLAGPLVGEVAGRTGARMPFLAPAAVSAIAAIAVLVACRDAVAAPTAPRPPSRGDGGHLAHLLGVSAAAAGGIVALEVYFVSPLSVTAAGRGSAALMLTLCGAVMLVAQVTVFAGRGAARRGIRLMRPLLVGLAVSLALAPFIRGPWPMAASISATAWASAALTALTGFLVARDAPAAHGRSLGYQYAAVSAGQMLAAASSSVGAGGPYALWISAAGALALTLAGRSITNSDMP